MHGKGKYLKVLFIDGSVVIILHMERIPQSDLKLEVHLLSGISLKCETFLTSTTNFYCSFALKSTQVGSEKYSSVRSGSSDPQWNETFLFDLPKLNPEDEVISISVWGKKKVFQDILIGRLELPLCFILENDKINGIECRKVEKKFKLLPRLGDRNYSETGYITLSLSSSNVIIPKVEEIQNYNCSTCFAMVSPSSFHVCEIGSQPYFRSQREIPIHQMNGYPYPIPYQNAQFSPNSYQQNREYSTDLVYSNHFSERHLIPAGDLLSFTPGKVTH